MKKLFALLLSLVLLLIPLSSLAAFADEPDPGYTFDEGTNTYTVTTADGLLAVNTQINTEKKFNRNITLAADIDLTGKTYVPLARGNNNAANSYSGTIDGAGHSIIGFSYNDPDNERFFGLVSAGAGMTAKNLTFVNPNIVVKAFAGCLIGRTYGDITISNVNVVNGTLVSPANNYMGGLIGRCEKPTKKLLVENCVIDVNITAVQSVGGIIGGEAAETNWEGTFRNVVVTGRLECTTDKNDRVGGIIGYSDTVILSFENCLVLARLIGAADVGSMASIQQKNNFSYTNCYSDKPFTGNLVTVEGNTTTIVNCAIFTNEAGKTSGDFFSIPMSAKPDGTVTVDGVEKSFKDLQIPVVNTEGLKTKVNAMYEGNDAMKTAAIAAIDAYVAHVHVFDQEVAKVAYLKEAANCNHGALYSKTCACGEASPTETFSVGDPTPHEFNETWSSNETEHWHACKNCGTEKKDVAAHTWGEWEIVKEATEEQAGLRTRTCTVCAQEESEMIPKLTPVTEEKPPVTTEKTPDATEGPKTTEKPETTTEATPAKKKGCGSVLGTSISVMMIVAGAATVICKKRKF